MAVTQSSLTAGNSGTGAQSYNTASITPSANKLILAAVAIFNATPANLGTISLSGNGLTWVQIDTQTGGGGTPDTRVALFRAMGASPSSGAVTITISGSTNADCCWSIVQWDGIDTSGTNGSGAIVQNNKGTASASSITITLGALGDASNNAVYICGFNYAGAAGASGSGYTLINSQQETVQGLSLADAYKVPGTTSAVLTFASAANLGAVAVEIKAAAAGGTIITRTLSDTVTVTDAPLRGVLDFRQIAEPSQTVIDRLLDGVAYGRVAHDNVDVTDATRRFCWLFRRLIDSADVTDACISTITLGSQVIVSRVLHDNLDVQDLCWRAAKLYRLNHDNADVADAVIREADLFRWAVDTLSVSETLARTFLLNRTTTDVTTAVDNAVRLTLLTRLLNDAVTVDERLVAQITYFQQMVGFVLMLLESTEFVAMRLEEEPIDMGVENLEFIKLEITDL